MSKTRDNFSPHLRNCKLSKSFSCRFIWVNAAVKTCMLFAVVAWVVVVVVVVVVGWSDWFSVRNIGLSVRRRNSQLAQSLGSDPGANPAADNPANLVRLWITAVDWQLCPSGWVRVWVSAVVCNVAARAVSEPQWQDHQRVCLHVTVRLSACRSHCIVLCQSALQVPQLSLFQLYSLRSKVL